MGSNKGTGNGKPKAERLHNTLGGVDKLPVLYPFEKEKDLKG